MNTIRIGHGYDVHALVPGRKLILGGVEISFSKGLLGHSDADVLTHAIMDALLGAAALGDIGKAFPDSSAEFKDISSLVLLKRVWAMLIEKGYSLGNVDATIVAQAPKLAPYLPQMRENLAKVLKTDIENINIKATTEEGLGFTGTGEGMAAHGVCVLIREV